MRHLLITLCCLCFASGCSSFDMPRMFGGGGTDVAGGYEGGGYTDNPYDDPFGSPFGFARGQAQNTGYPMAPQRMPQPTEPSMRDKMAEMFLGSNRKSFGSWFKERMTPRMMKDELFNTPSAFKKPGEDQPVNQAVRELRNGTRQLRARQRELYNNYALNTQQYLNQYDMPVREESSYGKGFDDGCKTFMSAVGAGPWRLIDHKRMDPERMVNDNWYLRGYNDGSNFCTSRTDWDMH